MLSYSDISELEQIVKEQNADLFYAIKAGNNDGVEVKVCKTVIHTVFQTYEPHGDVYAYVSEWLTNKMTQGKSPYVPHMINVEKTDENLRDQLGIPKDAIVFGRHGGENTFDVDFVKKTICKVADEKKDVYFLFLGTNEFDIRTFYNPFKNAYKQRPNIIFLPKSTDKLYLSKFINTCDAYLHARKQGESFGIAIGEFSVKNKPVITWSESKELSHIDLLGDKAILYKNKKDLHKILSEFKPEPNKNWDAYSKEFSPEVVMQKFKEVFLEEA